MWRRCLPLLVVVLAAPAAAALAQDEPDCFGAAERDPIRPCVHRGFDVRPLPEDALLEGSEPCEITRRDTPEVCEFGVRRSKARATFALVGDSHAVHWRAAMARVAKTRRWHGVSMTRSRCPFTSLLGPTSRHCIGWPQAVVEYLKRHPEVTSVFLSGLAGRPAKHVPGEKPVDTRIRGYTEMINSLPASVTRVYVIRDPPRASVTTRDCVARAMREYRNAGLRCARPKARALVADQQVAAAERMGGRVKVIDLTDYMCDAELCYPVVGGALVIKDIGHLTRTFSTSLGPYLSRAIATAG